MAAGLLTPGTASAAASPPAFTPAGTTASLSASSMQLSGFAYAGETTVAGKDALEFTAATASLTAFALVEPCRQAGAVQIASAQEAAQAALPAGLTVWVADIAYTDASGVQAWTPASPPAVGLLEPDGTTVTGVSATLLASSVPAISLGGFKTFAAICSAGSTSITTNSRSAPSPSPLPPPGAPAPALSPNPFSSPWPGASPLPLPEPSPSPSPDPSPDPTPTPGP